MCTFCACEQNFAFNTGVEVLTVCCSTIAPSAHLCATCRFTARDGLWHSPTLYLSSPAAPELIALNRFMCHPLVVGQRASWGITSVQISALSACTQPAAH